MIYEVFPIISDMQVSKMLDPAMIFSIWLDSHRCFSDRPLGGRPLFLRGSGGMRRAGGEGYGRGLISICP